MGGLTGPAAEISIGNVVSGGTPGSVLFVGAGGVLAEDNANLFWDTAKTRLGVGTATPNQRLEVVEPIVFNSIDTYPQFAVRPESGAIGRMLNIAYDLANDLSFIQSLNRGIGATTLQLQRYGGRLMIGMGIDDTVALLQVQESFKAYATAGANRYVTLTGSNGGNPTIGTSAGSLNIAPALQLSTLGAFAAGDKYLIVDATGNVHVSALGPGS